MSDLCTTALHDHRLPEPVFYYEPKTGRVASLARLERERPPGYWVPCHIEESIEHLLASQAPSEAALQPVGEIVAEDMGRPFNAIQIRCHFYTAVPPIGTKLFAAIAAEAGASNPVRPDGAPGGEG